MNSASFIPLSCICHRVNQFNGTFVNIFIEQMKSPSVMAASKASIVALVVSMILDLPGSVITWNYTATSYVVKLLSCLSFNVALTLGVHIMELHDASGNANHMIQANANSGIIHIIFYCNHYIILSPAAFTILGQYLSNISSL